MYEYKWDDISEVIWCVIICFEFWLNVVIFRVMFLFDKIWQGSYNMLQFEICG